MRFNDNDLVLGRSYVYTVVKEIFGGSLYTRFNIKYDPRDVIIDLEKKLYIAMKKSDNIRFFINGISVNDSLFTRKYHPDISSDYYTLYELQTVLLEQELFEKTVFYDIEGYEEHLNDVPYQSFIEYCQNHIHIVDIKDVLVNA